MGPGGSDRPGATARDRRAHAAGAAGEPEAVIALRAVPDLADASAERLACIARWAFHLYPPGPVRIQPDMLANGSSSPSSHRRRG